VCLQFSTWQMEDLVYLFYFNITITKKYTIKLSKYMINFATKVFHLLFVKIGFH